MTTPDEDPKLFDCPALSALQIISGKWKTRILWLLRERPHHFGELRRKLPGVSAKVLSEQISQLESQRIITRDEVSKGSVIYVHYAYSPYGRTLIPALDALGNWGLIHAQKT